MKIMVAYDGTVQAKEALVYGLSKARQKNGEVVALYVFNSPLFMDYDAVPGAEALARAEAARFIAEAKTIIGEKGTGIRTSMYSTEGNPEQEVIDFAKTQKVDVLLCPPKYRGIVNKYRKALAASELAGEAATMNLSAVSVLKQ